MCGTIFVNYFIFCIIQNNSVLVNLCYIDLCVTLIPSGTYLCRVYHLSVFFPYVNCTVGGGFSLFSLLRSIDCILICTRLVFLLFFISVIFLRTVCDKRSWVVAFPLHYVAIVFRSGCRRHSERSFCWN